MTSQSSTTKPLPQSASTPLPKHIQQLEQDLARRLENQEPIAWQLGHLGAYYHPWIHKTRTKTPIRFFHNELLERATYSHWLTALVMYMPLVTFYWNRVGVELPMANRVVAVVVGVLSWPLLEYGLHQYVYQRNHHFYMNVIHFCLMGQHAVCANDPLRSVLPPHVAFVVSLPLAMVGAGVLGWDRGMCWCIGVGAGFVAYDLFHYALHHHYCRGLPQNNWLERLRLRHLADHGTKHGTKDVRYFGISQEIIHEWFSDHGHGCGKDGMKEANDIPKSE